MTATLRKMGLCVNHKSITNHETKSHLSKVRRNKKEIYQWCGANGTPPIGAPIRCIQTNEKWFTDDVSLIWRVLCFINDYDAFNRELLVVSSANHKH